MTGFLFIVVLIGIPGIAGAVLIAEAPDRKSISSGASLLVYACVLSGTFAYTVPVGKVTGAQYFIKIPVVLVGSIVVGVIIGLVRRRAK
jgi:phosphatidylserine synthase